MSLYGTEESAAHRPYFFCSSLTLSSWSTAVEKWSLTIKDLFTNLFTGYSEKAIKYEVCVRERERGLFLFLCNTAQCFTVYLYTPWTLSSILSSFLDIAFLSAHIHAHILPFYLFFFFSPSATVVQWLAGSVSIHQQLVLCVCTSSFSLQ